MAGEGEAWWDDPAFMAQLAADWEAARARAEGTYTLLGPVERTAEGYRMQARCPDGEVRTVTISFLQDRTDGTD